MRVAVVSRRLTSGASIRPASRRRSPNPGLGLAVLSFGAIPWAIAAPGEGDASRADRSNAVVRCAADFASRAIDRPYPVELAFEVPADRHLLVRVDEAGPDVVVSVDRGTEPIRVDLPPSGRARQALVVPPEADRMSPVRVRIEAGGAARTGDRLVVRHACVAAGEADLIAWFDALGSVGRIVAAADGSGPKPARPVAEIDAIVARLAGRALDPRFAEAGAQLRHARAFLLGRGGQPLPAREAYLEAATAWETAGAHLEAWIARHRAAQQARRAGRFDLAIEELTRLVDDPRVANQPALRAIAMNDRCLTLRNLVRDDEALKCFPIASKALVAAGDRAEAALTTANHAELLIGRGRLDEAARLLAKARPWAESAGSHRVRALYSMTAGNLELHRGAFETAIATYADGTRHARAHGDRALEASGLVGLGSAFLAAGNLTRARELILAAAALYRAGGYSDLLGRSLVRLAEIERRAGDSEAALAHATAALAERIGAPGSAGRAQAHLVAAEAALDLGRLDSAAAHLDVLKPQLAGQDGRWARRARLAALRLASLRGADPRAALDEAAADALRIGDPLGWFAAQTLVAENHARHARLLDAEAAWRRSFERTLAIAARLSLPLLRAQFLATADVALGGYIETSARRTPAPGAASERLAAVLDWRAARDSGAASPTDEPTPGAETRLDAALLRYWVDLATGSRPHGEGAAAAPDAELGELLAQVEARSRGAAASALRSEPVDLERPESLAPMLVAVDFATTAFVWRVDERGVVERQVDADRVRGLVDALARQLDAGEIDRAALARDASSLSAALGLDRLLDGGRDRWRLLLGGRLADVPPLLLVVGDAVGQAGRADSPWPAIRLVRTAARRADAEPAGCCAGRALQVFGDPVPPDDGRERRALPWQRLPGARREASAIARIWRPQPVEIHLGAAFTREPVLAALREPGSIVHLATHGFVDRGDPARGGLWVASPTAPEGYEILGWNRIARQRAAAGLVVLSACEVGDGGDFDALGSIGIAQLLVDRGVDAVIAAVRPVEDRASVGFQTDLYRALAAGRTPDQALVEAQRLAIARGDLATALAYVVIGR